MNKEFPVIKFKQRDQDNARTPGGGNGKKPKFTLKGGDLAYHGEVLTGQLRNILDEWGSEFIEDIPKVVEIKYIENAKAKSHQSKIIEMFKNYKKTTQIGASSDNGIIVQLITKNQLNDIITKFQSHNENDVEISAVESIQEYKPTILNTENQEYNLTFWDFLDDEQNEKVISGVENLLSENEIHFKKDSFGGGEFVFEVSEVTPDKLEFIKKLPIKNIEPTEKTDYPFFEVEETELDLTLVEFKKEETYPLIGLLDSGVEINRYTKHWVTRGKGSTYNEEELNKEHGTYIASLLVHGDNFNNTSDFSIEGCRIVDVPVVPNKLIDSKRLICNIEKAIISNSEVKIWNLSISLQSEIDTLLFSNYAKELDRIQDENDVLIFKSAGNDSAFLDGLEAGKLSTGADSIKSVTVGSLNRGTDSYKITREGYPSPYSRIGKGPSFIIKPELVHFGGDLFALKEKPRTLDDYEKADGVGISIDGKEKREPGTSFSTPKVAKIAAELQLLLETEDLLLIKAMLVHSAHHSPLLELTEEEKLKKMGFGLPESSVNIISEVDNHSITLMMRGRLDKGKEIDIMDFPYPQSLIEDDRFKGRVKVTLVSDPYLRGDLASEYCQTNLDVKFGTYQNKEDVVGQRAAFNSIKRIDSQNVLLKNKYSKLLIKSNQSYNYERTLIEYSDKYYPVKKYACDLSELTNANQKYLDSSRNWYIYLKGEYRDYIIKEKDREYQEYINNQQSNEGFEDLGIDYCFLISIYDPKKEKDVYGSVVQELNHHGFNFENVTIENQITVDADITNDF